MGIGPVGYSEREDGAVTARALLDEAAAAVAEASSAQRAVLAKLLELWPTSAWLASGATSAKAWLLAYTDLGYHEALRLEQIAGLCAGHPPLAEAVLSGELPLRRAQVLARFVTTARARYFTEVLSVVLQLNRDTADDHSFTAGVRFWAEQVDQELAPRREQPHSLSMTPSLFGGGELHAHLSPAAFANVVTAIAAYTQDPDAADAPHQRCLRERQADALDDIATSVLAGGGTADLDDLDDDELDNWLEDEDIRATDTYDGTAETDLLDEHLDHLDDDIDLLDALRSQLRARETQRRRRTRARSGVTVNATVDVRTMLGIRDATDLQDVVLRGDGFTLTRGLLERLCCDAGMLVTLFDGQHSLIDANHRTERFTPAQRRAIATRDRCCVFPGCRRPPHHCDVHHLRERSRGGPTRVSNGALLCRHHHRLIHECGWQLDITDDGHWLATDRHGQTWTGRPAPPATATAA